MCVYPAQWSEPLNIRLAVIPQGLFPYSEWCCIVDAVPFTLGFLNLESIFLLFWLLGINAENNLGHKSSIERNFAAAIHKTAAMLSLSLSCYPQILS